MHSCAAEQHWKETLTLLRGAALQPSRVSYSTSITAAGRAQRWRLSVEAFESLQERLQCNVVTFGAIIGACEKGSQWRQSLRLLGRLQREDLEPNVIACSAVISACAKGDQWQLALQLLAHVVETRLEPNVQTYTAAISSCREHWLQALQLLLEMQESHLQANIITYSAVISCCPWHWALQLLMELEEGHLRSDVVLCNTVLRACEGQPSVVLALYSRLQLLGLADHVTYSTAINACGWQDAMLLLQQMHGQRLPGNVVVYNAGLKSCESSSAWQGAMKILEMMQAQGVPSDSITCSAAVSACRSAEQNDVALGIFWEMVAAKVEANVVSFTAAITACCDHRWPLALHLLSQLQDVDVVACNAAISAVSTTRFGEWVQALQLFRDMELQRIKANDKTYGALAKAFERGRQWQRALDLSSLGDGVPAGAAVSALSESAPMAPLLANLEDRTRTSPALLGHAGSEKAPANLDF